MNTFKYIKTIIIGLLASGLLFTSCLDDLDQEKPNNSNVDDVINEEGAKSFLAKIYSGFGLSSNVGGTDEEPDLDIDGIDQGSLVFLRGMFNMQELPTDEAIWNWTDEGIVELVNVNWDYTTNYSYTFYQRVMLNIRYCRAYLDMYEASSDIPNVELYRNEVRALRALNYYYLIDIYGNPGIVWDDSPIDDASWYPTPIGRAALFDLLVKELIDLSENSNLPEQTNMSTYGKMTKPVVWMILAKLYLNAEVYTGTPMYNEAAQYCQKLLNAGFGLEDNYVNLFCGENHLSPLRGNEIIFGIPFDADNARSNGGTIMLSVGASGGALNGNWFCNSNAGWTCMKPKETLVHKFDYASDAGEDRFKSNVKEDQRYLFFDILSYKPDASVDATWPFDPVTGITQYEVNERRAIETKLSDWDAGYLCRKFTNLGWDEAKVSTTLFPNTDFPLFRLADVYLMYAECAVRGATSANTATAVGLINDLRERAFGNTSTGQISSADLTLDFILDERARELYWEGHRRTDLIRFGKFTQGYAWPYKGGVREGIANINSKYNLYPFSDKDLTSNPMLGQNEGYKSLK